MVGLSEQSDTCSHTFLKQNVGMCEFLCILFHPLQKLRQNTLDEKMFVELLSP